MIEGFALWSERDANFRFDDLYRGELKLITSQFNAMAEEVEANRQRSLYLEKIASDFRRFVAPSLLGRAA